MNAILKGELIVKTVKQNIRQIRPWFINSPLIRRSCLPQGRFISTITSRNDVTWLWKVNGAVKDNKEANKQGTRQVVVEITLNGMKPLRHEHFHGAFQHFIREFPNLRTVIRTNGKEDWYCQLNETEFDFEFLTDENAFREECFKLMDEGFSGEESLPWKARVIERSPEVPCFVDGIKGSYPHQYDFMFIINHAMIDGMDLSIAISNYGHMLDCIAGNKPINRISPPCVFENNLDVDRLLQQRRKSLLEDSCRMEFIKSTMPKLDVPLLVQVFQRQEKVVPSTEYISRQVERTLVEKLIYNCKQQGVRLNAFAMAVTNIALVELMKEEGMNKDVYDISCLSLINARRYMNSKSHVLGCHVVPLTYNSKVENNTNDSFWEYCKHISSDLNTMYNKDVVALDQIAVQEMMEAQVVPPYNYTDNPRPIMHDYALSFYGDLSMFSHVGEFVQLTNLTTFQRLQNYKHGIFQEFYSVRGRSKLQFSYATEYYTEDTVSRIADKILHLYNVFGR